MIIQKKLPSKMIGTKMHSQVCWVMGSNENLVYVTAGRSRPIKLTNLIFHGLCEACHNIFLKIIHKTQLEFLLHNRDFTVFEMKNHVNARKDSVLLYSFCMLYSALLSHQYKCTATPRARVELFQMQH